MLQGMGFTKHIFRKQHIDQFGDRQAKKRRVPGQRLIQRALTIGFAETPHHAPCLEFDDGTEEFGSIGPLEIAEPGEVVEEFIADSGLDVNAPVIFVGAWIDCGHKRLIH